LRGFTLAINVESRERDNHWEIVYFGGGGDVGEAIRRIIDA
jgi:hypothetical protein